MSKSSYAAIQTNLLEKLPLSSFQSMLSRNALNPADIVVLHKLYNHPSEPPPVDLIRIPQFLELLIGKLYI